MALWQRRVASKFFCWQVLCSLPEASIVIYVHAVFLPSFILWVFLLVDCHCVCRGLDLGESPLWQEESNLDDPLHYGSFL